MFTIIIYGAADIRAILRARNLTVSQDLFNTRLRAPARNIFIENAMVSARGARQEAFEMK